jgi:hypothetical protein
MAQLQRTRGSQDEAKPLRLAASLRPLWRDLAAAALLLALTLVTLRALLPAPVQLILGAPGDNIQYVYAAGWMARAPLVGGSPFFDPGRNYPDGLQLMATDVPYVALLAVAPVTWLGGAVLGYNAVIALSFFCSGLFTYLWARRAAGSYAGGLIAGAAFVLTPYRSLHAYGHLQLVATFGLPLFFWALDDLMAGRPRPARLALLLAGATFLVGSGSQYYLVIAALTGAAYVLLRTGPTPAALLRRGPLAALAVLAGGGLSALPYLTAARAGLFAPYTIDSTRPWSAEPASFLLPPPIHPLWGEAMLRLWPDPLVIERSIYLGLVPLALAALALRWRDQPARARLAAWAGTAAVALLFALGTDLHWRGLPLRQEEPLWLPAYYLGRLPGAELMRVWSRFGVVAALFVALLAGAGVASLVRRVRRPGLAAGAALLLLMIDLAPGNLRVSVLAPRAADGWLAEQPVAPAAALPAFDDRTNYLALFGSLTHNQPMPAYMHAAHPPAAYTAFAASVADFPSAGSLAALRALGVRYLILEQARFAAPQAPAWPEVMSALAERGLPVVQALDGVVIVDLEAELP